MIINENKLISEIESLQSNFSLVTQKLIRDVKRQDKIMARSDKRQKEEYDALEAQLNEIKSLQHEIVQTQIEIIFTMGAVGESRSKETGNHVKRVAAYSKALALHSGLSLEEAERLKQASPMHDIGKIGIPDSILNKPGKLTFEEYEIMKTHAQLGYDMLKYSERPLLKAAAIVAHEHHEKYDGSGYPRGLKGENIHIFGRITALADVFDALGSDRVYKKAWDDERLLDLFREQKGAHFDPMLIDIFLNNLDEFYEIRSEFSDIPKE
jgi:response regulator RpfG family c-di-GMP phosphodiesterase